MIKSFIKHIYYYLLIKNSGLFDCSFYLNTYSDVRQANINPLWHFVTFGWKEGRNPSKVFDTGFYIKKYPDVELLNINPLVHFIKYGQREAGFNQWGIGRRSNEHSVELN